MTVRPSVVSALSDAFLAGPWTHDGLVARAQWVVGSDFDARPLADIVLAAFPTPPYSREVLLRATIGAFWARPDDDDGEDDDGEDDDGEDDDDGVGESDVEEVESEWHAETSRSREQLAAQLIAEFPEREDRIRELFASMPFAPLPGAPSREVPKPPTCVVRRLLVDPTPDPPPAPMPPLATAWDLASWLGVDLQTLEWLAQSRRHYRRREVPRPDGEPRVLQIPGPQLAAVQRRLGRELFAAAPIHDAAHGFRSGRSAATHAAPHAGREIVIRIDLADFFTTIHAGRVATVLNRLGYRESVARLLARLVTVGGRLPQGAPSSPAVSNLCAWRLDRRLHGLAQTALANYTRYADDLTFSGDRELARRAARFSTHVAAVVHDVGFTVNHRKTRVMHRGTQQRVTGLVVNAAPAVARRERDQLRAILTNCVRHGPESQNRHGHEDFRAHLLGRIGWVAGSSAAHAIPLRALFDAIVWPA